MIAVVDYGAGNLGSVHKALRYIGASVEVTRAPDAVRRADALVLPGVGAFRHCMAGLAEAGLTGAVRAFVESGRPFLGICVGLQMLFSESEERGWEPGLGVLPGRVVRLRFDGSEGEGLKVPHVGWNALRFPREGALFRDVPDGARAYFVHSYHPEPDDPGLTTALTDHGYPFCCAVERGNIHATQFHPEKSGAVGLRILRNFAGLVA
ncbi:MAG TPA: imidazole glycerol phosphate synthase subunit HisH [Chthonomonadales bacterium]|nr:imidazole glycerol phosphate synthase subunit HisH [Chthonomonadales bacterium]